MISVVRRGKSCFCPTLYVVETLADLTTIKRREEISLSYCIKNGVWTTLDGELTVVLKIHSWHSQYATR
jgi:hypothetical protein